MAVAALATAVAALAAASGQAPDASPPSLLDATPDLDLNGAPPTLTLKFDEDVAAAPAGAVPGADTSLVEIAGVSGRPVVGLAGAAAGHPQSSRTALVINITKEQHGALSAAHRFAAPLALTVMPGAVHDASGNPFAGVRNASMDVTPDTTRPSAAGAASLLNLTDGMLRMSFDEAVDAARADLSGITVHVAVSPSRTVATTMAGASASQGEPGELVVAMTEAQRLRLVGLRQVGSGSAAGALTIAVSHTAVPDFAGNHWIGTLFSGADVPTVADDESAPALAPAAPPPLLNLRAGTLALYFDEAVNRTAVNSSLVSVGHAGGSTRAGVSLAGAQVLSQADSDVLVLGLGAAQTAALRDSAAAAAQAAQDAAALSGSLAPPPPQNWTVTIGRGAASDMAGNPFMGASVPAAAAHAAAARNPCMDGGDPCRYGITESYGEAVAREGRAVSVSADGGRSYVAYDPPPGSRAARIDAIGLSDGHGVLASIEFEPPAPGMLSAVGALALDGATGAPLVAVQETHARGAGPAAANASSYIAPLHPASLGELRRVPLSYLSHNGTAADSDEIVSVGTDAAGRLVLAAVSGGAAGPGGLYRQRGAVLAAGADTLEPYPMYLSRPGQADGYYHPDHAWMPTAMEVGAAGGAGRAAAAATAYVAGVALGGAAARPGHALPGPYGIHTVSFGNASSGFAPNYTAVHSLVLAGPHAAPRPDAGSFVITSLALGGRGGNGSGASLYALYANGTLAAHALEPGSGAAAGRAVPSGGVRVSQGLAGSAGGPGIAVDGARGLLYAVRAGLSSVDVYDLRAEPGPALAATVPVPGPARALAASAADGAVHVLAGLDPGAGRGAGGSAVYVVAPGALPLSLGAPPSLDLRTGSLALALDRRADVSEIDASGIVLYGAGMRSEPVRLAGAAVDLRGADTDTPVIVLTEGQRRAAVRAHAWDGPLLLNISGGAVPGLFGAPLAAASAVPVGIAAGVDNASIVSAAVVGPREVRVEYDAPVNASAASYSGLALSPGGAREIEAVRGAGTAVHTLQVGGARLPPDAAGRMDVSRLPDEGARSTFDGAAAAPVADAQGPSAVSSAVVNASLAVVVFDEPVAGVDASDFGALSIGAPPLRAAAAFAVESASGSGASRLLAVGGGPPGGLPGNAHGSLAIEPGSFEDLAGNANAAGQDLHVTPGRPTATSDGRTPVPAAAGMYASTVVATSAAGASLDLSPLGGLPLPGSGVITIDTFAAAVLLPSNSSVVAGMPADGVVRVSPSDAEVGARAQIGGGRILALVDAGGAGGSPVRLDAPAAVVFPGAAGAVAFLQGPGAAAPEAVRGWCGEEADAAVRPAELREAAEAYLNGTGSCAADLGGDRAVVTFVLTTLGVAAAAPPGAPGAAAAAVCGGTGGAAQGPGRCAPPAVALLDTGGLAATDVAAAPARGPVFVAAAPAAAGRAGPSVLVYDIESGLSPAAAAGLGAGGEVLALAAAGNSSAAAGPLAYAIVAPAGAGGQADAAAAPAAELVGIAANGTVGRSAAGLSYIDASGREARVGASDRITGLHIDPAAGRAYVAVLAGPGERNGLGTDGTIISVDAAADPPRVLRQYAGPYDPALAASGSQRQPHYYYPAEAWRPTALAMDAGSRPPMAYAVGSRLAAPDAAAAAAAPGGPLAAPSSFGVQAVSFGSAGAPALFTPNYTLAGEAVAARTAGSAGSGTAVPGLPAAGAVLDGAGEKMYVLYGNGTLAAYAVAGRNGPSAGPAADRAAPRLLYVVDVLDGPAGLDMDAAGGILYAAGSGGIRAYDARADLLIGSLGAGSAAHGAAGGPVVSMDSAAGAGTLYAVLANGSVLVAGAAAAAAHAAAAAAQEGPPTVLESLVDSTPDGGTALVPPGAYDNESLVLDRPIRMAADPPGSAVLGPSSRITVLVPRSGTVAVEGIAFNGTRCAAGGPSVPESAAVRVSDGAWWDPAGRQGGAAGARLGGAVLVLNNSFSRTCGAAVHSDAEAASAVAVRSNMLESIGAAAAGGGAGPRAAVAVEGLAGRASVESNYVYGSAGYAVSVHNASGVLVSGNRAEDAAGGVSASSSSAVRVSGNTFAGMSGPVVLAQGVGAAAPNATGLLSDGLAVVLNDMRGAAVALSIGPGNGTAPAAPAAAGAPHVRFNYNTLHPHGGAAPAISSADASARVDARSNYYPGLGGGEFPRILGAAAASVLADPAAAPPGGPVRIGVLLDPLSLPHMDGPAAAASRSAADEANRRTAGSAVLRPVELVEARGAAGPAEAARTIAAGAAGDAAAEPALLRGVGLAMAWYAESPDDAPARMAGMPDRGYSVFAAGTDGTVIAAGGAGGGAGAPPVPGRPAPAAAADPAAFARAVEALGAAPAGTTAWIGHALPDGTVVRTLLALDGGNRSGGAPAAGIVFGASYGAGPPPSAYVGPTSAAGLAGAAAALPDGTPVVSPGVVDGRAVAAAGASVFSMAPAASAFSAPVAGQVMSEERVAAVIPVVQADDYSLRFAAAALAEYAARSHAGLVLRSVTFAPSEDSAKFWSSVAGGMDAAASELARRGLEPYEVAVLFVGGSAPFESLAAHALPRPALAGAQWYVGDAAAQITDVPGLPGNGSLGAGRQGAQPPPWYAPGGGAANGTAATALSRQTALVAFALEPAHGHAVRPEAAAAASSVLGEIRLRQAASAVRPEAAAAVPAPGGTMATAYAYLAHDAVLLLAQAVPAAEGADPDSPRYGASIRQAASSPGAAYAGVVGRAAFDAGGSLAHPAPYALWISSPSGPPVRAGTVASEPPVCRTALSSGLLEFGGVSPGNASQPARQAVTNAGTAPLNAVVVNATDWMPAPPGAEALPFNLTSLAVGAPPPGAPPPDAHSGAFLPLSRDAAILRSLAPGNSVELQFALNLTSVSAAPAAPIEQIVTYTAGCS